MAAAAAIGRAAHAGLVGEDPPRDALLDGDHDCGAEESAGCRAAGEGIVADQPEGGRYFVREAEQDDQAAGHVDDRHHRHHDGGNPADIFDAAEDNHAGEQRQGDTGGQRVDIERFLQVSGNGVGLDGIADAESGDRAEQGEQHPQPFLPQSPLQIIHRTARHLAVLVNHPVFDGQHPFGVLGSHAECRRDPHPEQRARPADRDRGGNADDVSRTDGCGQGHHQCLEVADIALLIGFGTDKGFVQSVAQHSDLQTAQPDG